jgi:hypothetical protein
VCRGERAALATLIDAWPEPIVGTDLAARCGYEWSGGFRNALSKLRTLELIAGTKSGGMTAHPDLIEALQ